MFNTNIRLLRLLRATAIGLLLAGTAISAPAVLAQETHVTISSSAYGATRSIQLETNKSMTIDLPAGVAEVVVSQPNIAAAIMRTRNRAILQGLQEGSTNIIFMDDAGRTMAVLDVDVAQAASGIGMALESTLARVIPGSRIKVETISKNAADNTTFFVLTGTVLTAEDKAIAEQLASELSDDQEKKGSLIQVIGPQQVMLQVTVSEVNRDVAKQFGINFSGSLNVGSVNLGLNSPASASMPGNGVSGSFGIGNVQIDAAIRALETRGALRVLAQPTLTAISGQEAKFLAGGEIPYAVYDPVSQTRTVEFKPYGVELKFTPLVKSNNLIGLTVDTSVSDPQADGSLTRRQATTSVELPAGTTLAIGGLLQETSRQQIEQLPGLGNIPILGALFRSRDFQTQQTELVILVTPFLVAPSPLNAIAVPTDMTRPSTDAEGIFLGKVESLYGVGSTGEMRGSISGSVGFVLD